MCLGVVLKYFKTAFGDGFTEDMVQGWTNFMLLFAAIVKHTGEGRELEVWYSVTVPSQVTLYMRCLFLGAAREGR